jgi:hypothetical protein
MRVITTDEFVVDGCRYHIAVMLSGTRDYRYTAEWWRAGDTQRVRDQTMFDQSQDAISWAREQIRTTHGNAT